MQPPPSPVCFLKMPPSWQHLHACISTDTRRQEEVADDGREKSTLSLWYLLWLPPTRRTILDNISAFEAAKLVHLKLCVLTPKERERYLKPLRDLVWNVPAVERLSREGMKLTLLGDGAYALEQRLHATERYLDSHGNALRGIPALCDLTVTNTNWGACALSQTQM
ncbi:hypothetical protein AA0117_g12704 [Alternaria alternata]|uniref:Uncharacterized protein n=1 Tax=Alternaria alternata TaxID=5599 RepID=A0A4V1WPU9_ALTAL|nr:hypothetical protein AA0117_g12704 [Alternaria alternata]RYO04017.1 hypothetical protein AA0121_g12885 [Alternaria tenuissima]